MKVVVLPTAVQDIAWFRHYYRAVFPAVSDGARANLRAVQALIAANPYIGHPSEAHPEVREYPVKRTPLVVIYRVSPDQIEILRLWDGRQGGQF